MQCWPWIARRACNGPKVRTRRSPEIVVTDDALAGCGVVAIADIAQDEIVAIKAGHIVTAAEIEQVTAAEGDLALQSPTISTSHLALRSADEVDDMAVFINHSCDPNVGFRGQVVCVAMRDIRCDKDWKFPEPQQRYGDYFLIYISKEINRG